MRRAPEAKHMLHRHLFRQRIVMANDLVSGAVELRELPRSRALFNRKKSELRNVRMRLFFECDHKVLDGYCSGLHPGWFKWNSVVHPWSDAAERVSPTDTAYFHYSCVSAHYPRFTHRVGVLYAPIIKSYLYEFSGLMFSVPFAD